MSHFSARVMRGDRVGLIGPNGVGKTTLLRMLLGSLTRPRKRSGVEPTFADAYYDQQREQLDPDRTVFDTIGGATTPSRSTAHPPRPQLPAGIPVSGPERVQSPRQGAVGGARTGCWSRVVHPPGNMCHPRRADQRPRPRDPEVTRERASSKWPGELLLVSHDRRVPGRWLVTQHVVFESEGRCGSIVGEGTKTRSGSARRTEALRRAGDRGPEPCRLQRDLASGGQVEKAFLQDKRELEALPAHVRLARGRATRS